MLRRLGTTRRCAAPVAVPLVPLTYRYPPEDDHLAKRLQLKCPGCGRGYRWHGSAGVKPVGNLQKRMQSARGAQSAHTQTGGRAVLSAVVAATLRALRVGANLTQAEVAAAVGVTVSR